MKKIIDDKYRKIIKYYLYLINDDVKSIQELEKYNIDNDELDNCYMRIIGLMEDCYKRIRKEEYGDTT